MQSQIVLVSLQFPFAFNSKHKNLSLEPDWICFEATMIYTSMNVPKKSNYAINQCNHIDADKHKNLKCYTIINPMNYFWSKYRCL